MMWFFLPECRGALWEHRRAEEKFSSHRSSLIFFLPGCWSSDVADVPVSSSYSPSWCWSQTSQQQKPLVTWMHQQMTNLVQSSNNILYHKKNDVIILRNQRNLLRASCAPGTAMSSICRVPLRSMRTAFRARLPAMMETCRGTRGWIWAEVWKNT